MASKKSKPIKRQGVTIVNPAASSSIPLDTPMPFSEVPTTVYNGQPVQPLTTPKLRQIVDGGSVKIIGKNDGI